MMTLIDIENKRTRASGASEASTAHADRYRELHAQGSIGEIFQGFGNWRKWRGTFHRLDSAGIKPRIGRFQHL